MPGLTYTPLAQRELPPDALAALVQELAQSRFADMQQGSANARMNPSAPGFGVAPVGPAPARGLASLPEAFSPEEMAQWDKLQGFHSEMAGGRPMWVAPDTSRPASGGDMNYMQWQYKNTGQNGPSQASGKDTPTSRVRSQLAAIGATSALDKAAKQSARKATAEKQLELAATDPVSQRARANQMRRGGVPMEQALALQQIMGGGANNPLAAEIAMPGRGGVLAMQGNQLASQERQSTARNKAIVDAAGAKAPDKLMQAATMWSTIANSETASPAMRAKATQQLEILAGQLGGTKPNGVVGASVVPAGGTANPHLPQGYTPQDITDPAERQKAINWQNEQAGRVDENVAKEYDSLFSSNAPISLRWGANNAANREATIKLLESLGKPRAAVEKWYDLRYGPVLQPTPAIDKGFSGYQGYPSGV